ncbi:response regulator [Cellulophaga sp. F20128]|uniref:response regulator n=1 Tax=Cellulophaga sp. F20128 TaxID=2926413 RepID=UPI001FF180D7|nr:response regulator [Cellulophaga sp. F20128]
MINTACIIDDDPIYIFGTKKIMEATNFCNDFLIYKNGKDAVDDLIPKISAGESLPDVILLDLNMPIMDGWQVLDELVKIPTDHKIKIYIVSSSVNSADVERAKSYSLVSNYLIKPFSVDKIHDLMKDLEN